MHLASGRVCKAFLFVLFTRRHHKVRGNKNEIRAPAVCPPGHLRVAWAFNGNSRRAFFAPHGWMYSAAQVLFTKQPAVCLCANIPILRRADRRVLFQQKWALDRVGVTILEHFVSRLWNGHVKNRQSDQRNGDTKGKSHCFIICTFLFAEHPLSLLRKNSVLQLLL